MMPEYQILTSKRIFTFGDSESVEMSDGVIYTYPLFLTNPIGTCFAVQRNGKEYEYGSWDVRFAFVISPDHRFIASGIETGVS